LFDLLELQVIVAIRGPGDGLCAQLLSAELKFVQIGLPALAFGSLDGKSNLDFWLLLGWRLSPARDHANQNKYAADFRQPNPHKHLQAGALSAHSNHGPQHDIL